MEGRGYKILIYVTGNLQKEVIWVVISTLMKLQTLTSQLQA